MEALMILVWVVAIILIIYFGKKHRDKRTREQIEEYEKEKEKNDLLS